MSLSKKLKSLYFDLHKYYNMISIKKAYKKKIANECPKNILTPEQKKMIKRYFKKYKNINTKYHNFYCSKTGKFSVDYLPDDLYYCNIDMYYNNWNAATILDNKCFYKDMFKEIKQPETIVMRINNFWYNEKMEIISLEECVRKIKKEKEIFIKKATESAGGKGVIYLKIKDNTDENLINTIKSITSDIIIQKALKQHKELARLNQSSVNTIRMISLLSNNGVKIYSSIIRMGINGAKVDNASSGGITCGIENDGRLKKVAYAANGKKYHKHPTSKLNFDEIKVPKFTEMKKVIEKIHPKLPHFRLISWDMAVDENEEIVLIEANLKYGELDFHQLNNGPLFGEDTEKILNEVFRK